MRFHLFAHLLVAQVLGVSVALAESENLLPLTFQNFESSLKKELNRSSARYPVTLNVCLDGDSTKRKVCTYKISDFMAVSIESLPGGQDVTGITMICGAKDTVDTAKCLITYISAMNIAASETKIENRSKILKLLMDGLAVGNSTTVSTDDRKFTLQKSIGLWFHIYAFDIPD